MKLVDEMLAGTLLTPREYQRRIVQKARQMFKGEYYNGANELETAASSVMIESPTGSGKTCMALCVAKILQREIEDLTVGWVAMRRNLLGQAERENVNQGIHVQDIHFTSMFDKHPTNLIEAKRAGKPLMMIVDEAQHDAANSMAHLHNVLEPDMILGMTATPFRTDSVKLCFQKVIKDAGIHALIQDGFLAPFHHYTIPEWSPRVVADFYLASPERWGKSIFYFANLDQCREFQVHMGAAGVSSEFVSGSSDRDSQIARLAAPVEAGGVDVLVNCMVLTEGFDFPALQTAFVRDSGKGPTMQMAGRAFRNHPDLPFKQVVQSKNSRWPFIRTALPAQSFVWTDGEWRSLEVNPQLNFINQQARLAIAMTPVDLPEFVVNNRKKKKASTWRG